MEERMQDKMQTQDEINLMDILRLFIRKLKVLLIVVLIAVVVGGSVGYFKTRNENYFGTTVAFYVNPQKDENSDKESEYGVYGSYGENVMDNMVKLLSSEMFAETLMLDKNGLPDADMVDKIKASKGEAVANALQVLIDEAQVKIDEVSELKADYQKKSIETIKAKANRDNCWNILKTAGLDVGNDPKILDENKTEYDGYEDKVIESNNAITVYAAAVSAQKDASDALDNAESLTAPLVAKVIDQWRVDYSDFYAAELMRYKKFASYSYRRNSDAADANIARSFFYVDLSVSGKDAKAAEEFANNFRERIIEYVPMFIEEWMPVPNGYSSTNCQRITRTDDIHNTNAGYTTKTAIKYALILAAVSFVVACIVLVIIDRSDKRLRSVEQITEMFNLPVLGVIPNIHITKNEDTEEDKK